MPLTVSLVRSNARTRLAEAFPQASIQTIALEADVLLAHVLQCDALQLSARREQLLDETVVNHFHSLLNQRLTSKPIAYILGEKEFFGRLFRVNRSTLIPRPDTEILVEQVLRRAAESAAPASLLDVGCGSGCIGLSLAAEFQRRAWNCEIVLSDVCAEALNVAKQNAAHLELENQVAFSGGYLLQAFQRVPEWVVSNLPYIPESDELMPDVQDWEPVLALRGGRKGTELIEALINDWSLRADAGNRLFLEIGESQQHEVESLARAAHCSSIESFPDLSGIYRVVELVL